MRVILVRHAMPELEPDVPAHRWRLGAEGQAAARALQLPTAAYLVASSEQKAADTLRAATGARPVVQDAGFDEVHRPSEWRDDHRERARAYVHGATHPGWEAQHDVAARFTAAIRRHAAAAGGRPLVVGSHGMALTCWLAAEHLLSVPAGDFWAALAFPQLIEVDLPVPGDTVHGFLLAP